MMAMSLGLLLSIGDALAEKLNSPTKKLEMNFELNEAGEPTYSLKMAERLSLRQVRWDSK